VTITDLALGQRATVETVRGDTRTAVRIMELGLMPGSIVELRGRVFGNLRLAVGSTRLALDAGLAQNVRVTPIATVGAGR